MQTEIEKANEVAEFRGVVRDVEGVVFELVEPRRVQRATP